MERIGRALFPCSRLRLAPGVQKDLGINSGAGPHSKTLRAPKPSIPQANTPSSETTLIESWGFKETRSQSDMAFLFLSADGHFPHPPGQASGV